MRRFGPGIAGALLVALLAGCSDTGPQEGPVAFKKSNTEQLTNLKNQMAKNVKDQAYMKPATEGPKAAGEAKKPEAEAKPADQSKPADQPKPAGEPKPAEKKG